MPTRPADLSAMLRADAIGLALGGLLLLAGLLTIVLWIGARRRAASLRKSSGGGLWLGVFACLYGVRLLVRARTIQAGFDVAPWVWDYVASAITYIIPLPIVLFIRVFWPAWRRLATIGSVGLTVFAAYAIASDAILHRPESASTPNNLIAVGFLTFLVGAFFWPGRAPSRELSTARIGVLSWSLTAVVDNLEGMRVLSYSGPELEPFGFTVLVACLGTIAARRVLDDSRRLVAIDRELAVARQIQSSILPQAMPRLSRVTVAARYRPLAAVAGDFYDFLEIDDRRLGVLLADVSGHGVPAALIASMVKVALAAQQGCADRPAALLTGMNKTLFGRLGGQYVTAAYVFIDERSGLFRYAAAGHPPMLHLARSSGGVRELEKNGLALGFAPAASYDELELPLEGGERLLLYTDGLIEAANAADDLYGLERVKTAIAAGAAQPLEVAAEGLLRSVDSWSGQPATDDLTIVLVDYA
jgi:sigma-B regulation protein RsbU (phosphoserine phosphatase)